MREFGKMSLEELLAMVLNTKQGNVVVKEITARYSTARSLYQASINELKEIKGIGSQKACLLKAILELGIRIVGVSEDDTSAITCPTEVVALLQPRMQLLDREHFMVVSLTTKNKIISIETASIGSLNSTIVHPREIFKNAIKVSAAAIILAHNHPSGDPTPSREDLEVTKRIVQAGEIIGIKVLDHIIIGDSGFFSLKEKGLV